MTYLLLLFRLVLRPLLREPGRAILTTVAVGLGISVVLAIEMAGEAAAGSFRSTLETLAGDADFEVTASGGIPPSVLTKLSSAPYALELNPRIEDFATVVASGRSVPFIGIDVLAHLGTSTASALEENLREWKEDSVWVGPDLGRKPGEKLELLINDQARTFAIQGVLPSGAADAIVADLSLATNVLGREGQLDRILIKLPRQDQGRDWEPLLRAVVPEAIQLLPFGSRTEENRRMLGAFRWNLRVLSYIALVVGACLIYNTISVSVVRRRAEIGILRALGSTRSFVASFFLIEAAIFGLFGALIGCFAGRVLAESAVRLVAATVESLYVSSRPGAIQLTWTLVVYSFCLALGIALTSALSPSMEAAAVQPVEAMSRGRRDHVVRLQWRRNLALFLLFACFALAGSQAPAVAGKPLFGYASAICMIAATAFVIPPLVFFLLKKTSKRLGQTLGVEALLGAKSLAGSLRRTSVLVCALATAIAMTTAIGIMVGSFRQTVVLWMDDRLQADLYLRPAGVATADRHPTLASDTADRLKALPEIADVDAFRAYEITYNGRTATLGAGDSRIAGERAKRYLVSGSTSRDTFSRLASEPDSVLISEPFANKNNLASGDSLVLTLGGQAHTFRVLDVFYDYVSERGYVVMDRGTLLRYLPDPAPSNVAVYLKSNVSLQDGKIAVERALRDRRVLVFSNRSLREEAVKTFDRTFAITYALEVVSVIVAIMGVAGALLALVIDRRRDFALLRFLGASKVQVRKVVLFEAGLLGLLANVAGLVLGIFLSFLLIFVINKQSFGWTIQFHWPGAVLIASLTLVYLATVLAGFLPARVAAGLQPIEVIHEE